MEQKIIITGCAGLLGSHLSRHLLNKGYTVVGVDDLSGGYRDFLPDHDNFHFYKLEIENSFHDLQNIFNFYKPVACFHFAAYAAEGLSPFIRHFNYTNNTLASVNIINCCINHDCKLIFTSSMAVYGDQTPPFTEDMIPKPIDPYGVAKYGVEMDIKCGYEQHGLRYTIVRPHNVIGIYQNIWDKYRNVVGIFIRKALDGEPILVYGDGHQTRAFSDIKFYLQPFEQFIRNFDGETFNLGADKVWSINEVADIVVEIAAEQDIQCEIKHVEPRHEVQCAHCNQTKAKHLLEFTDNTDLKTLTKEMFLWAMKQPKRNQKIANMEITKGLYEYWK